jgi:hypothetical protein
MVTRCQVSNQNLLVLAEGLGRGLLGYVAIQHLFTITKIYEIVYENNTSNDETKEQETKVTQTNIRWKPIQNPSSLVCKCIYVISR